MGEEGKNGEQCVKLKADFIKYWTKAQKNGQDGTGLGEVSWLTESEVGTEKREAWAMLSFSVCDMGMEKAQGKTNSDFKIGYPRPRNMLSTYYNYIFHVNVCFCIKI
jgi:hypothetical protein